MTSITFFADYARVGAIVVTDEHTSSNNLLALLSHATERFKTGSEVIIEL
jgi:hypothetical protein